MKQRRSPRPSHLQESVATLRDAAKDLVLDATRLWREQKGAAWTFSGGPSVTHPAAGS